LITSTSLIRSQSLHSEKGIPFIKNYSPKEYKGHEQNWAITQDHRGVIYVGNSDAVLEYDGVYWRSINTPSPDIVRSLAVDESGQIYVGGHDYFGYLAPDSIGVMKYVSLDKKLKPDDCNFRDIWKTHATSKGVYFQANPVIFLWANDKIKVWKPKTKFNKSFVIRDTLYTRQIDIGLMRMMDDSLQLIRGGEFYANKKIYAMIPMDKNKILIGTRNHGFFFYDGISSTGFPMEADHFLQVNKLYGSVALPNQMIALATLTGGVAIVDGNGKLIQILNRTSGIINNKVWNLFYDREGGLWLATNYGLSRIQFPAPLTFFDERLGLKGTVEFIKRYNNQLFVATHQGLFSMTTAQKEDNHGKFINRFNITSQVGKLLVTGNSLLISDSELGTYELKDDKLTLINSYNTYTMAMSCIDSNLIYMGLPDGIAFMSRNNGRWIDGGKIVLDLGPIRYIVETKTGNLWLGTSKSLICRLYYTSKREKKEWFLYPEIEIYDQKHGLPASDQYWVFSFAENVYFGTSQGLYRFSENQNRFVPDSTFRNDFTNEERSVERLAVSSS